MKMGYLQLILTKNLTIASLIKLISENLINSDKVSGAEKVMIENLLRTWGWKEDDRSKIKIDRFLNNNNTLRPKNLTFAFHHEKSFFFDFVKALAIVKLTTLNEVIRETDFLAVLDLPDLLRKNLSRALEDSWVEKNP